MNLGSIGTESSFSEYKRKRPNKKFRSHLVSERFLLTIIKVLSSDVSILRRTLTNIKRFLEVIDREYYSADTTIEAMLLTCDMLLSMRMKNPGAPDLSSLLFKVDNLLVEPYDEAKNNLIMPQIKISKAELPEDDLEFINATLDQNLKYNFIINIKDDLIDISNEITTCSYTDFPTIMLKYRNIITEIMNFFRSTDSNTSLNEIAHTTDPDFISMLYETYMAIRNPSCSLQTGWQAMNSSLGPTGGFQNKNVYLYNANTNSFKSALLLQIARSIKMYNGSRVIDEFKKTGKIPTILFIEMENDFDEDNERLYKMVVHKDLGKCTSKEELFGSWNHEFTSDKNENPIDISFLHVEARKLTVEKIDEIIENLEEEGYKVIVSIIDYLGLIAPKIEDSGIEPRLKLQHIADDLLSLAKRRDIPVITAHQLNRSGGAVLDNIKAQGGSNAVLELTNEYIGESFGIIQAVSWAAFIDTETHNGKKYLMFKRSKARKQQYGADHFVMEIKDGLIIEDDIFNDKPLSMDRIPDSDMGNTNSSQTMNVGKRGVIDIRDKKPEPTTPKNHIIEIKQNEISPDSIFMQFADTNESVMKTINEFYVLNPDYEISVCDVDENDDEYVWMMDNELSITDMN